MNVEEELRRREERAASKGLDAGALVGIEGMSSQQFAEQTSALREFDIEDEDNIPSQIVLRADYDTVLAAITAKAPDLAALTSPETGNRLIADAMVAIAHAARRFARFHGLQPNEVALNQVTCTSATLIWKASHA